jgi:maleate isomerase
MYGWRARLGMLLPSGNITMEHEFGLVAPEGVTCHYHRFKFTGQGDDMDAVVASLKKAEDYIGDAAEIICDARPSVIAMVGTGVSFIDGIGQDKRLIKRMRERSGNLPATTTSTSVIEAFARMGLKRVSVAMPYPEIVAKQAVQFVKDSGYDVLAFSWLGKHGPAMADIAPETLYRQVREVDRPDSEAVFISCVGLHTFQIIEKLERDLAKPVITSNQATIWSMLRMAGIADKIKGFGKLLAEC